MLAVKVCRKLRPPTGPSSPWAKKPAVGTRSVAAATLAASWSGSPKKRRPRPLQENSSTPRGRQLGTGASSSSRSSSAEAASRTWNWRVWPTSTLSPTAIDPLSWAIPSSPLTRKSPRSKLALCSSITWPTWRPPPRSSACSRGSSAASSWRRRSTAELVDDVALPAGDRERRADRPAALADHRPHLDRADQGDPDRAAVDHLGAGDQPVPARLAGAGDHAADHR